MKSYVRKWLPWDHHWLRSLVCRGFWASLVLVLFSALEAIVNHSWWNLRAVRGVNSNSEGLVIPSQQAELWVQFAFHDRVYEPKGREHKLCDSHGRLSAGETQSWRGICGLIHRRSNENTWCWPTPVLNAVTCLVIWRAHWKHWREFRSSCKMTQAWESILQWQIWRTWICLIYEGKNWGVLLKRCVPAW